MSVPDKDEFDDLFAEAEQNLKKQEIPDDWGSLRQTEEGERILARYLGQEVMPPFNDVVFRFVTYPGEPEPFYLKHKAQLEQALENASVGDIVGLVRGRDKDIGKPNPMETWDGWARPCDEPFTTSPPAADAGQPAAVRPPTTTSRSSKRMPSTLIARRCSGGSAAGTASSASRSPGRPRTAPRTRTTCVRSR